MLTIRRHGIEKEFDTMTLEGRAESDKVTTKLFGEFWILRSAID
jgi:hypothetical protein